MRLRLLSSPRLFERIRYDQAEVLHQILYGLCNQQATSFKHYKQADITCILHSVLVSQTENKCNASHFIPANHKHKYNSQQTQAISMALNSKTIFLSTKTITSMSYFSAMEKCFSLTTFQHNHQHKPNFSLSEQGHNVLPRHVHLTQQRWDWDWDWIYSSSIHTPLWYRTDYSTSGCQSTNPSIHKMHALLSTIATLEVFSSYKHILRLLLPYITRFHLNLHKATPVIRHL